MTEPLRVVIADDQALVRTGFRMILAADGIDVVADAANGVEAVGAVRRTRPDVVLMDVRMPEMDGLEATRRILSGAGVEAPRVILTTFDLDRYVYAALSAGASGFLLKDVSPEHLVAAVRLVRSGDALLAPAITRRLIERYATQDRQTAAPHRDLSTLTPRELEVMRLLARGLSNAELATSLRLSNATVKTHVARILSKLGLRDRAQAIVVAYETGLVTPAPNLPDQRSTPTRATQRALVSPASSGSSRSRVETYPGVVKPEELKHLRRARDLIDREYARPLDVPALARAAHMSPAHFSRQFRAAYGETPYSYLMTRRIERAMTLLRRGDLSVTDVCMAVGCTSLGSFSARFTELVGEPPSAYRARNHAAGASVPGCWTKLVTRPSRIREAQTGSAS